MGWFIHHCSSGLVLATQLQARSNHKDDCHRVLVPKSQVENILQCFGLIFILMDRLGALLSTLGANLVKERFFRDTLYKVVRQQDGSIKMPSADKNVAISIISKIFSSLKASNSTQHCNALVTYLYKM